MRGALERNAGMRKEAEEWLTERFDPARNRFTDGAWTPTWQYAYLWALERWCGLTQRERVAGRDHDEFNPLSRRMEFEPA